MSKSSAFFIALLSALLFGAATPVSKPLLESFSSYQLAGLLYLGACLGVIIPGLKSPKPFFSMRMNRKNGLRLAGAVIFGGVFGPLALLSGLRLASAASVSMWLNLELVATAILGHFIFKDHLTRKSWVAAGGIFLAAILLGFGEGVAGAQAGLLVAVACLCWGIDNHLTALIDDITPMQSTFWKGLVAGSTNLMIGIMLSPLPNAGWIYLAALGIGVFAYGMSIVLYITSAQQLGATRSQLIFSSAPFWGVLLSILLLGERLKLLHGIAAVIFIASIALLLREQHLHPHTHEMQQHEHFHHHQDEHHNHHDENENAGWHMHTHAHVPITHAHAHTPDLHHRHVHVEEN